MQFSKQADCYVPGRKLPQFRDDIIIPFARFALWRGLDIVVAGPGLHHSLQYFEHETAPPPPRPRSPGKTVAHIMASLRELRCFSSDRPNFAALEQDDLRKHGMLSSLRTVAAPCSYDLCACKNKKEKRLCGGRANSPHCALAAFHKILYTWKVTLRVLPEEDIPIRDLEKIIEVHRQAHPWTWSGLASSQPQGSPQAIRSRRKAMPTIRK